MRCRPRGRSAITCTHGGHATLVRSLAQRFATISGHLHDRALQIASQFYLAYANHVPGDYAEAETACRNLMESLHDDGTPQRYGLAVFPDVMCDPIDSHARFPLRTFSTPLMHFRGSSGSRPTRTAGSPF